MPYLLKLYSEACGFRHTRPSAPVLPCTPDVSQRPQQPTARHRLYRRRHPLGRIGYLHSHRQDIEAFPPRVRVRVARSCSLAEMGSKAALQPPAPRCSVGEPY